MDSTGSKVASESRSPAVFATPELVGYMATGRPAPTPSESTLAEEEARGSRRQRVETPPRTHRSPQSIAAEEFGFLNFRSTKHYTCQLPLCLFLFHHKRGGETRTGNAAQVLGWVRQWLSTSDYARVVHVDADARQISGVMRELKKKHAKRFGIGEIVTNGRDPTKFSLEAKGFKEWSSTLSGLWPPHWSVVDRSGGNVSLSTDEKGAKVKVTFRCDDGVGGGGEVKAVTFNGNCVRNHPALGTLLTDISSRKDIAQVLYHVISVQPCHGVCAQHVAAETDMPEGSAEAFTSVVRMAECGVGGAKDLPHAHEGRWKDPSVRGCLAGHKGVSGVLGFVRGRDVLWSYACDGVASMYRGSSSVPRCSHCKLFWRHALIPRIHNALKEDAERSTATGNMTSAQKDRKLQRLAEELKKANEEKARLGEQILVMRKECV